MSTFLLQDAKIANQGGKVGGELIVAIVAHQKEVRPSFDCS